MSYSAGFEDPINVASMQINTSKAHLDAHELQDQLFQLKRKFKEVKKRYRQEKEVWMREKEMMLKKVAGIQLEAKKSKQCVEITPCKTRGSLVTEQQCLLATMDLNKQLENGKINWSMEKMELLQCFDNERKEWESQLMDMQWKIEQIYWDVNSRQECKLNGQRNERGQRKNASDDWAPTDQDLGKNTNDSLFIEELSLESFEKDGHSQNMGSPENDKNKCSSVLNAALQEIAKVSEELCSYQKEVQNKIGTGRNTSYPYLQAHEKKCQEMTLIRKDTSSDDKFSMSNDLFKAFHPTLSQYQKSSEDIHNEENRNHSTQDEYVFSAGLSGGNGINVISPIKGKAPPVPPRTSSLLLASSFLVFPQDHDDSLKEDNSNCETYSHIMGTSYSGPNEAMLQENEEHILKNAWDFKASVPLIKYDTGPKSSTNNSSWWSCDTTNIDSGTENKYIGSKVNLSSDKGHLLPIQENNFPSPSKATGICSTSGVCLHPSIDAPATQADSFRKTTLSFESCDPIVRGRSVVQSATKPGQGSSFAIHSAGNVHATRQFPSKHMDYACGSRKPLYITNTKIAEQKHHYRFPGQMVDNDKRHRFDKINKIPNSFSNPTHAWEAKSNFDNGWPTLRHNERSSNPSFQVMNSIASFADNRPKQYASCTDGMQENSKGNSDFFQLVHLNQEKEMEKTSRQSHQRVSGQQLSLPVTLLPVTGRLNGMSFSRPAIPQNRRLPSRWATSSPSAPDSLKRCLQKHNQAFRFDIKTSMI
ncbi:uncharacterized protein KIAA0408-like isoform X3 [Leucoraja erinacea]|uniref:uncharacterized protein KIAA0408-like isoform X3 n=1 Tax=Leucoraja erinaceus TaxID=7782 RepID=UPI0024556E8B|nr:uncharacterized protein KIAA0408-like isoform X3 [Leucoraja erinacea]